jgi:hypothetical protein
MLQLSSSSLVATGHRTKEGIKALQGKHRNRQKRLEGIQRCFEAPFCQAGIEATAEQSPHFFFGAGLAFLLFESFLSSACSEGDVS